MVGQPLLIGGLNVLVSYTPLPRDYQADSLRLHIFSRSHQFHSYPPPSAPTPAPRVPAAVITSFQSLVLIVDFLLLLLLFS